MDNYTGYFAASLAGHDKCMIYVIVGSDKEYVYLSDGRLKTVDNPKKKKLKHIQIIKKTDDTITGKMQNGITVTNEDVKLAIKKFTKLN